MRILILSSILFFGLWSKAEVNFSRGTLKIAGKVLAVEIAESEEQHAQGLMLRKSLKKNSGMIFIFSNSEVRRFWMKNTFIPLSIGYFDESQSLFDIQDMAPVTSVLESNPRAYPSARPAKFALEVNQGWFKKNRIKLGSKFVLIRL